MKSSLSLLKTYCFFDSPTHDEEANGFPYLAMRVSHKWHDVIVSTPSVWSRINVSRVTMESLHPRIRRSGTVPLDIVGEWTTEPHPLIIPALMALLAHLPRWRSISLRFTGISPVRDLLEVVRFVSRYAG